MKTGTTSFYLTSLILLYVTSLYPQEVRPVRDDVGYCWQADKFNLFIEWLDQNCTDDKYNSENLVAGISPHDDYLYAGEIYYPLFKLIHTKEVVIFGVTHGTVRKQINDPKNIIILDEFDKWKGPYKNVETSPLRNKIRQQLNPDYYIVSNKAQSLEHSIEGLIPFLQHYNHDFKITPIMVTAMSFERMDSISVRLTEIISNYIKENNLKFGKDIFFLFSNDANHYGEDFENQPYGLNEMAHKIATANDIRVADQTLKGTIDIDGIKKLSNELWPEAGVSKECPLWCGRYSVVFGLRTVSKIVNQSGKIMTGKIFKYSDTWTEGVLPVKGTMMGITAPYSLKHWVGFFSAGFYLD
jgi:AmmeMemoRadiSam system protein B